MRVYLKNSLLQWQQARFLAQKASATTRLFGLAFVWGGGAACQGPMSATAALTMMPQDLEQWQTQLHHLIAGR